MRKRRIAALEVDVAKRRKALGTAAESLSYAAGEIGTRDRRITILAADVSKKAKALGLADGATR